MKLFKVILPLVFALAIFFFSWLPHPSFRELHFFPNWLVQWTDEYQNLRTAVPFIPLSISLKVVTQKSNRGIILLCLVLALFAELGQLFLPMRSFDMWDIFFALLGAMIGLLFLYVFDIFRKRSFEL